MKFRDVSLTYDVCASIEARRLSGGGGQNSGKLGICCIGGLERATGPDKGLGNRTPAQVEALVALVRDTLERHLLATAR